MCSQVEYCFSHLEDTHRVSIRQKTLDKNFSSWNRFTRFEMNNLTGKGRKQRNRRKGSKSCFKKEERRKKRRMAIQREAREEMSSPLKIIDLDTSFVVIHPSLVSILGPVFLLLAITSIISSESQQSWHLACILSVDNFTFLHELNVYSIKPRPRLDKGILMESGSTRN